MEHLPAGQEKRFQSGANAPRASLADAQYQSQARLPGGAGRFAARGADYESDDLAKPETLIPSSDWADHDVGPAEDIHVTLGDYGRVLEVELPHLMDLRRGLY